MKVKFNAGDMCAIPEGCKATIKDGVVIFEKEERKEQEFKDGDVLCSFYNDTVLIFKDVNKCDRDYFDSHYNNKGFGDKRWCRESFRHATEEEKQLLFDKMKEQGLKWNAEEKKVEKLLWRADVGVKYYFVDSLLDVLYIKECRSNLCNKHYSASNYFHTEEQAEEAAKRIKEVLFNYHEEIGE